MRVCACAHARVSGGVGVYMHAPICIPDSQAQPRRLLAVEGDQMEIGGAQRKKPSPHQIQRQLYAVAERAVPNSQAAVFVLQVHTSCAEQEDSKRHCCLLIISIIFSISY